MGVSTTGFVVLDLETLQTVEVRTIKIDDGTFMDKTELQKLGVGQKSGAHICHWIPFPWKSLLDNKQDRNIPTGRKPISCKSSFRTKSDGRKKSRLVGRGFTQVQHYEET